ncbi:MAG: 4Fe-4S dicluster domain-containing protein, partial [Thaumarchaeota archaeon]|nr:4Fe-4S dicluster domain-containing protein [Nitrososphaerota archaeon]
MKSYNLPEFLIERDDSRCIRCRVCERQCGWNVHSYDAEEDKMVHNEQDCAGCQRCAGFCPTKA